MATSPAAATHVWYAAYGSNCDDDRFGCYLAGGRPNGSTRMHTGCRDTTAPTGVRPVVVPFDLYFGGHSPFWGGAVAYLDPDYNPDAATLAIARRIAVDQFADVVAQECGTTSASADLPLDDLMTRGRIDLAGVYGTVVAIGLLDGDPVVTCTSAQPRRVGVPSSAYLATMRAGLARRWPGVAVDRYLDAHTLAAEVAAHLPTPGSLPARPATDTARQLQLV